jgi:prepilin-type N-terminal cleavage/methylation domain-containing protein
MEQMIDMPGRAHAQPYRYPSRRHRHFGPQPHGHRQLMRISLIWTFGHKMKPFMTPCLPARCKPFAAYHDSGTSLRRVPDMTRVDGFASDVHLLGVGRPGTSKQKQAVNHHWYHKPETTLITMKVRHFRHAGFTLLEIMIVVSIIGLLAAIAIPVFAPARARSAQNLCISNLRHIDDAKAQ